MPKRLVAAAIMLALSGTAAFAQGVAPGGPISGSTAMGSGLGGVGGTGPSWPNGTNQAPQPTISPPPPGGAPLPSSTPSLSPSSSIPTARPNYYPQPQAPYSATAHRQPATVPLQLPAAPAADLYFLKGCWRTDVFRDGEQYGLTTWCFNGQGTGKLLYTRVNQPEFFCHADAEASYAARQLRLHSQAAKCTDGSTLALGDLACDRTAAGEAHCTGNPSAKTPAEIWTVRLYRVR